MPCQLTVRAFTAFSVHQVTSLSDRSRRTQNGAFFGLGAWGSEDIRLGRKVNTNAAKDNSPSIGACGQRAAVQQLKRRFSTLWVFGGLPLLATRSLEPSTDTRAPIGSVGIMKIALPPLNAAVPNIFDPCSRVTTSSSGGRFQM